MTSLPCFLCDEMLHRLGRWLRTAGYDTVIAAEAAPDADLVARAKAEGRLLVTRDRPLLKRRDAIGRTLLITSDQVFEQALELTSLVPLDWLSHAFTRCTLCNATLEPATQEQMMSAPETVKALKMPVRHCPNCGRLYWPGGHERRMRTMLEAFARGW